MKLLTGNDLKSGHVVWWDGEQWSKFVNSAADVGDRGEALIAREEGARHVVGAYVVDGDSAVRTPIRAGAGTSIRWTGPPITSMPIPCSR